jgi:hypothetical protein
VGEVDKRYTAAVPVLEGEGHGGRKTRKKEILFFSLQLNRGGGNDDKA